MEHNSPHHWGYVANTTTPQNHWAPPPHSRSKRSMSESDCDELYSEESSKEQVSPGAPGSCQLMSRKKRRGVIEKKRRDRINSSLSELKRLVPSAYEKQGSAKLEKAEILQLTVEHLKNLHSKGVDTLSYDHQRFAMDYHIIGFRECAAEVARYLITIEGMDIQDPLRLRLISHLQYFAQQRELSAKSCVRSSSWTTPAAASYQPNCSSTSYQSYASPPTHHAASTSYIPNLPNPIQSYPTLNSPATSNRIHIEQQQQSYPTLNSPPTSNSMHREQQSQTTPGHSTHSSANTVPALSDSITIINHQSSQQPQHPTQQIQTQSQGHQTQSQTSHDSHQQQYLQDQTHQGATYIELTNSQSISAQPNPVTSSSNVVSYDSSAEYPVSAAQIYNPNSGLNYVSANGSKPYRPWGTEMAY